MTDEAAATPAAVDSGAASGSEAPVTGTPPAAPAAAATPAAEASTTTLLGTKPEVELGEDGNPKPPEEAKPEGAPETYEAFVVPEGFSLEEGDAKSFSEIARKHNLSQAAAQEFMDLGASRVAALAQQQQDAYKAITEGWAASTKADPEIGGKNLPATVKYAQKALAAFGEGTDAADAFETTGLGNHPGIIKMLARIGKDLSEDSVVAGGNSTQPERKSAAEVLYPNMAKQS